MCVWWGVCDTSSKCVCGAYLGASVCVVGEVYACVWCMWVCVSICVVCGLCMHWCVVCMCAVHAWVWCGCVYMNNNFST